MVTAGVVTLSLLLSSCSGTADRQEPSSPSTVVSYAGAASRLRGLDRSEQAEQLRDWARTGLAADLELDTAQLRDSSYDTVPVRDPGFAAMARQPIGPGRALFDGRVLHLLVPKDDPHRVRTIGLLTDQHRADAGQDPEQVQVHTYQVHPIDQTIELTADDPMSTAAARGANGWVSMRVDQADGLTGFLSRIRHLSTLELRGSEVWAGGWEWPDVPAIPVDHEDVSAIQRGYRLPKNEPLPGFSLDPGPLKTAEDIRAVVPGLSEEWARRLVRYREDPDQGAVGELVEMVDRGLFEDTIKPADLEARGLPSSRIGLWALSALLDGAPAYGEARYDGRLAGTNVGMTLFYTDYIAKSWASGVGNALPDRAIGFVPKSEAATPWAHCGGPDDPLQESGRLWFGQNDSAFDFADNTVAIGATATRLFARSNGEDGTEVEPSFAFASRLQWWDAHYLAVADYEPQYQRLDQIMRWSGALEWLTTKTSATLPQLEDSKIRSDQTFKNWYTANNALKERSPVEFAAPPSAKQESVRNIPSKTFDDCGLRAITGGVSLGNALQRKGGNDFQLKAPEPARRAGTFAEESSFTKDSAKVTQISLDGSGKVVDPVQRTITPGKGGSALIEVTGGRHRVESFGGLKVRRNDSAQRTIGLQLFADKGKVRLTASVEKAELGTLSAEKNQPRSIVVEWRPGLMDRVRRVLESIQKAFVSEPGGKIPTASEGALLRYQVGDRFWYKVDGNEFVEFSQHPSPGDALTFQLGRPHPDTKLPQFFEANLSRGPPPGQVANGGPWMKITPGDDGGLAVRSTPPDSSARQVKVSTPDGQSASVFLSEKEVRVSEIDPLAGLPGRPEVAATLGRFHAVAEGMRDAGVANDGLLRAVSLGESGVALASPSEVIAVAANHPWAVHIGRSRGFDRLQPVLVRIEGDNLVVISRDEFTVDGGAPVRHTTMDRVTSVGGDIYVDEAIRPVIGYADGRIHADSLPRDRKVVVRTAIVRPAQAQDSIPVQQPDIRVRNGREWTRIDGSGGHAFLPSSGNGRGSPPSAPGAGSGGPIPTIGPEVFVVIYLVCLDDDSEAADRCGE